MLNKLIHDVLIQDRSRLSHELTVSLLVAVAWNCYKVLYQHTMYVRGMYQPSINYMTTFQNDLLLKSFTIGTGNLQINYSLTSMQLIVVLQVSAILPKSVFLYMV